MSKKTTATGGAQGKRAAIGTFWRDGAAYALFSDGFAQPAQRDELRGLPHLAAPFAEAYVRAAQQEAREEKEREAEIARRAKLKHWRVRWTEEYEKVFEAESEDQAIENRDDDNAFVGCMEITAQEVKTCGKCQGQGRGDHGGQCGACEGGWVAAVEPQEAR